MLSTESVRDTQSMPTCVYEVRKGSRTGDIVRYASVGDAVYHEWECRSGKFLQTGEILRFELQQTGLAKLILKDTCGFSASSSKNHVFAFCKLQKSSKNPGHTGFYKTMTCGKGNSHQEPII